MPLGFGCVFRGLGGGGLVVRGDGLRRWAGGHWGGGVVFASPWVAILLGGRAGCLHVRKGRCSVHGVVSVAHWVALEVMPRC